VSLNSFTFLLGTQTNDYEIRYFNEELQLVYTFGKYYSCEHAEGVKPLIFTTDGSVFKSMITHYVPFESDASELIAETNVL
jgi:hypothetical protein